jgi:hypothetical protein
VWHDIAFRLLRVLFLLLLFLLWLLHWCWSVSRCLARQRHGEDDLDSNAVNDLLRLLAAAGCLQARQQCCGQVAGEGQVL